MSQPLSNGRRIWRVCLISHRCFLSLTSLLLILSSLLLCQMSCSFSPGCFLLSWVPRSWPSTHAYGFYCGCCNPRTGARTGITAAPAPLSPAFKQAIREFVLVLLLHAEDDPGLGCCLLVDKTFGPGIPNVYSHFLFWMCSLSLRCLSPPRTGCF